MWGPFRLLRGSTGAKGGEKCEQLIDCTNGAGCIGRRWYQSCKSDADCQSGWHCGTTRVEVTTRHHVVFEEKSAGSEQICFAPAK